VTDRSIKQNGKSFTTPADKEELLATSENKTKLTFSIGKVGFLRPTLFYYR
jgi:hypothetical protein